MEKKAILVLEDGKSFFGNSYGASGESVGLVVFNTAVVGYQEMLTDPANAGKILVLTYPLIGNYGTNEKFSESEKIWTSALVIKEDSRIYSNWQAASGLEEFLRKYNAAAITGVDTRTLSVHIRNKGEMLGIISARDFQKESLLKKLRDYKARGERGFLSKFLARQERIKGAANKKVVLINLGVSRDILNQLQKMDFDTTIVPHDISLSEIMRFLPRGVIISGGPEQDPGLDKTVDTIRQLAGKLPLLGLATGHEVLARALGARIKKMKLGHHGLNYPVIKPGSLKGEITVQNHSFLVDEGSLPKKDIEIAERNLNDHSIEKLKSEKLKFISIQYCASSPGMQEVHPVFIEFAQLLKKSKVKSR
jgi:carbamoyl-phosphate synthase small subunit